jgi:predicted ATPase/DNA-binding SARP family transcriptional activator
MRFRLLGPLEVGDGLLVRGARERKLLALLLLEAPAVVTRAAAAEWLLGVDSTADESGVYVAVSRLRRQLRDHQVDATIERTPRGLRLVTDLEAIDSIRFKRVVLEARTLPGNGNNHHRVLLREALALWRGDVLGGEDIPPHPTVTALTELRFAALEEAFGASLASGDDSSDLAELLALCRDNPHRERLWAVAMLALYRAGRQVEALALYQEARNRLLDALGLEPGPELVELERWILSHDQALAPVHTATGPASDLSPRLGASPAPGHPPVHATSFVGREVELKDVLDLVRAHRMVTLTGVGGVGKTRLAVQVAAELLGEFPDGVWLVELAPLADPEVVPDAAATVLGVTAQAGLGVVESLVQALSGRRLLIVLDNCEHVLDAAADLVEAILGRTSTVQVIATSREGLRVGAEQLWAVPPLGLQGGTTSAAVELFVDRAQAVVASFALRGQADAEAVEEICRRLDGIPLAIELAAARMVSMTPQDVRDRLGDRFRLLAGSRRGPERHQTLRHAVGWSYDLLNDTERALLMCCSVFADGFELAAAVHVNNCFDEYTVLHGLDSLVRKSLVTTDRRGGHIRYGMLETIRQFAEEQLVATGEIEQVRDCHASYFAKQAVVHWKLWDGPGQRIALDWVDVELANLRTGFRWATDQGDLPTAVAIAAHTVVVAWVSQRFEPVGWAEEIVPAATVADVPQLPRLYTAASLCLFTGSPEVGVDRAETALALEAVPGYEPFPDGWSQVNRAFAEIYAGRVDQGLEIFADLAARAGPPRVYGCCGQTLLLAALGRSQEAVAIAEETLAAARAHGNPLWVAWALDGFGQAFVKTDPTKALIAYQEGLAYCRKHRIAVMEAAIAREAARVETVHGDPDRGLKLYDSAIDSFQQSGNLANLGVTLANLALFFMRIERPETAATLYGSTTQILTPIPGVRPGTIERLRFVLGDIPFERCVATGATMECAEAVHYAREQIQLARRELQVPVGR